jgi:hypothetical protein
VNAGEQDPQREQEQGGHRVGGTRVVILTTFDLDDYVVAAFRPGASGFLLKTAPPAQRWCSPTRTGSSARANGRSVVLCPVRVRRNGVNATKIGDAMKFMMLVCVDPGRFAEDEAADTAENGDADNMGSFPWLDDVIARGIRLHGDRLRPAEEAKTVLVRDGEVLVSDGPFAETKEIICGYDMLECDSLQEAVQVASAHPVARFGKIEVRAVWP